MFYRCPLALAGPLLLVMVSATYADERFSFATVKQMAERLAGAPHTPPRRAADAFLKLDYDKYRLIAARHENALWRDDKLPFWVEFFAAGFIYEYACEISTVDAAGKVTSLQAGPQWFQYRGDAAALAATPDGGFSGFRLLTQFAKQNEKTEFLVFQGASYFRGRGANQVYGASARGLAIDIGLPSPEEFPRFTKLWIEQPAPDAKAARVYALLDGPAVSGAYQFTIVPGDELDMDVEADVWFRHAVQKIGIAPLTSMWMWEGKSAPTNDHRPEVHDSDGLLIHANTDEWTWLPLSRPVKPQVSTWPVEELRGFGLMQRDRQADHYRDNEAKYDQRPSLWVTPANDWGRGHVELLELPSDGEGIDNIGAYWVPNEPATAGSHRSLRYRLTFGDGPRDSRPSLLVADTNVEAVGDVVSYELAFSGAHHTSAKLMPNVSTDAGHVENIQVHATEDGRTKLRFNFRPPSNGQARLQAQLGAPDKPVSEKWSYLWTPK